MKEIRFEIKHNTDNWRDREIRRQDVASVLFQDARLLCKAVKKSFINILSWEGEPPTTTEKEEKEKKDNGSKVEYQPWMGYALAARIKYRPYFAENISPFLQNKLNPDIL
ncbi:Hypothetical predicted protein [Octopus vulgaris]|uniref:Uncharacterized protein n=1 Tax=Octopus vulgaris TaxID=6645 RepID=A0AA36F5P1_OCTVU|nr:Hypothetical predicted protein [Octopus vulgaris]